MTENGFDEWNMGYIFHLMTQQSIGDEATVVFAENHQQVISRRQVMLRVLCYKISDYQRTLTRSSVPFLLFGDRLVQRVDKKF